MDSADYIADLEEEARTLRRRVSELEEELRETREELRVALERKVEEVSVPRISTLQVRTAVNMPLPQPIGIHLD